MSAEVVYIPDNRPTRHVDVPGANHFEVNSDGYLLLRTSSYGTRLALIKEWSRVVITPDRDANGRFVKRVY